MTEAYTDHLNVFVIVIDISNECLKGLDPFNTFIVYGILATWKDETLQVS